MKMPQTMMRTMGSSLRIMKKFWIRLPSLMPKRLTALRSTIIPMAMALQARGERGTRLAMASGKATARAAMEPEEPRIKLENPLIKATRSP